MSIFWVLKRARTFLSSQNIDKRAKKRGPLFLLIFWAARSLVCSFYWAVRSLYRYFYWYFKYLIFLWQFLKWEPIFALILKMAVRSWIRLKISIFWPLALMSIRWGITFKIMTHHSSTLSQIITSSSLPLISTKMQTISAKSQMFVAQRPLLMASAVSS